MGEFTAFPSVTGEQALAEDFFSNRVLFTERYHPKSDVYQ
jgi:hypothetical protein